jgi:NTP pyrophosphatase (non-canonical NTP hydrolase)
MKHFNELTPAESERLACLAEEMGEAIQIIGKILRHGYNNYHPDNPQISNKGLLMKELADVQGVYTMLCISGDIPHEKIMDMAYEKRQKMQKYLHHQ